MRRFSFTPTMVFLCALAAGSGWINTSQASIRNDGGGATMGWGSVGMIGRDTGSGFSYDSTGAVVGSDGFNILTAKHCVTTDGTITGPIMSPSDIGFRLGEFFSIGATITPIPGCDIAVIKLINPTGVAGYDLYDATILGTEIGQTMASAGFGQSSSGNPFIGLAGSTWDLAYGTKREWTNDIDAILPGSLVGQGPVLRFDWDDAPGTEGLGGPGDSGSPVFLSGFIAGVFSSGTLPVYDDGYGSAVQVSDAGILPYIQSAIPEPACLSLVVIPLLMLGRKR